MGTLRAALRVVRVALVWLIAAAIVAEVVLYVWLRPRTG